MISRVYEWTNEWTNEQSKTVRGRTRQESLRFFILKQPLSNAQCFFFVFMPKTWTWPDISKIEMQWIGWIRNFLVYTVKGLIINCLTMSFCIFKTFLTFYSPNSMNTYLLVNIFSRCFLFNVSYQTLSTLAWFWIHQLMQRHLHVYLITMLGPNSW